MYIFPRNSHTNDFKKWSDTHQPGNDDDNNSGGATPIAIAEPLRDEVEATREPPHRPWLAAGGGGSI